MKIITRCINITAYIYLLRARSKGEGGGSQFWKIYVPITYNAQFYKLVAPPPLYGSTKITENVSINR